MPIYDFECKACQAEFEALVRNQDAPQCPECGGKKLQRLLSAPAAHTGASRDLPVASHENGGCGRPQCGSNGCMGMG